MVARIRTAAAAAVLLVTAAGPALGDATAGPLEPIDLGGAALPGGDASTDPGNPTELRAGLWADTLVAGDSPHQFSYTRTIRDSTVHLGVIGAPGGEESESIDVEAFDAERQSCDSDSASSSAFPVPQVVVGVGLWVGPSDPGTRDGSCTTSETITFTVERGTSSSALDLPIAVKVVEEAPPQGGGDLPTPAPSAAAEPPDAGSVEQLEGATSFDDAPEIESGTSYALDIPEGGQRLFRVRLDWGQSLDARVDVGAQPEGLEEQFGYSSPAVELGFVDPMRNTISSGVDGAQGGAFGEEPEPAIDGIRPVRFLNRYDDAVGSLPGDYWVRVTAEPGDEGEPYGIPVTLTVQVRGDAEGAPSYPETVQDPAGGAGPDGYAADTPFLVGDDAFSADPSGNPPPSSGDDGDDGLGPRRIGGAALLVVSLGLCVVGVLRLRRRPV